MEVNIAELIDELITFNQSTVNAMIALLEKIEGDLSSPDTPDLQGEKEEILREIIEGVMKTLETVLAFQQELQASIIESYFPAQD